MDRLREVTPTTAYGKELHGKLIVTKIKGIGIG
jgi:hypothetical protein